MQSAPTVSVIMPVYNGATHLPATLDSLWAQSFADFELIVVDDGSTDGTRDLLAAQHDPRVRTILADRNAGPVASRNRAVAAARGRYLAALDADDLCLPDRFARQVAVLDRQPSLVLAATAAALLEGGRLRASAAPGQTTPSFIAWLLGLCNPILWSSVMMRADAVGKLDAFMRPERVYAEDFDLYHRLSALGQMARIDEILLHYRCHPGGISQQNRDRMAAQSAAILTERNAAHWPDGARASADLIVRHVMLEEPVPNAAALAGVIAAITALPLPADAEGVALATAHIDKLVTRLARIAVRSGVVPAQQVMRAWPAGTPPTGFTQFEWRAVGALRAAFNRRGEIGGRIGRLGPALAFCAML